VKLGQLTNLNEIFHVQVHVSVYQLEFQKGLSFKLAIQKRNIDGTLIQTAEMTKMKLNGKKD